MIREHPEAYSAKGDARIDVVRLRDQVTSRARTVLWVLMAASLLIFVIACSNVANLVLARSVRRSVDSTRRPRRASRRHAGSQVGVITRIRSNGYSPSITMRLAS
jgi:hypothetical protein